MAGTFTRQDSIPIPTTQDSIKPPVVEDTLVHQKPDTIQQKADAPDTMQIRQPVTSQSIREDVSNAPEETIAIKPLVTDSLPKIYQTESNYHIIYNIPVRKIKPSQDSNFIGRKIEHQTTIIKEFPRERKSQQIGVEWFNLTLYAVVILSYIWLQFFNKKYVQDFIKSTFNFQLGNKFFRERNLLIKRILFILNLIFYISISLFIYQVLVYYNYPINPSKVLSFFIIILIAFGIVQLKRIALLITGKLFLIDPIVQEYIFNSQLVNKTLGLILLPVTVLITYLELGIMHELVIFGLLLIVFSLVLKFIKGLKIILRYNLYLYHIILYLCTLEILPILIGIKFFVDIS